MAANTSINTPHKMESFSKIMEWHIAITDNARGVWYRNKWLFKREYLYIDLYAGPGQYENDPYYNGAGSPIIAANALNAARMPYNAMLFNNDNGECQKLSNLMATDNAEVINDDNQNAVNYLQCFKNQFGLAYFDPNNVLFDFDLGMKISACLPKVDLLFYLWGRVEKRERNSPNTPLGEGHYTLEKMRLLDKQYWFVHSLCSKDQWTFLLGTNADIGDWQKEGWYRVDTPRGQTTLTRLNWTGHEIASGQAWQRGFDFLDEEE
jgi:hypothetical protein